MYSVHNICVHYFFCMPGTMEEGGGHILTAFMASATLYKDTTCRMWSYFHMPLVSLRCLPWDGAYLELVAAGSNYCPGMARTWDQLTVPAISAG